MVKVGANYLRLKIESGLLLLRNDWAGSSRRLHYSEAGGSAGKPILVTPARWSVNTAPPTHL